MIAKAAKAQIDAVTDSAKTGLRKRSTGISGAGIRRPRRTSSIAATAATTSPAAAGRLAPSRVSVSAPTKKRPNIAALRSALVQSKAPAGLLGPRQVPGEPEVQEPERHVDREEPGPGADGEDARGERRGDGRGDRDHEPVEADAAAEMGIGIGVADERPVHAHDRGAADPLQTRAAISSGRLSESAQPSEPRVKTATPTA